MLKRLRPRSAYDVLAVIAFFVAIGTGGAYAANTIGSSDVIDESLLSQDVKNGEVKNADIGADAMTSSKLANGSVQNSDLGPDAVTTSKIKAANVGNSDLGANAVTSGKVQDDALTGDDVLESSLGKVGDADTLDGFDWFDFLQADRHGGQLPAARRPGLGRLPRRDRHGGRRRSARRHGLEGFRPARWLRATATAPSTRGPGSRWSHLNDGRVPGHLPDGTLGTLCPPVVTVHRVRRDRPPSAELSGSGCSGLGAGNFTVKTLDDDGCAHDTPFLFIAM